jgi:hypothetical protein
MLLKSISVYGKLGESIESGEPHGSPDYPLRGDGEVGSMSATFASWTSFPCADTFVFASPTAEEPGSSRQGKEYLVLKQGIPDA